VRLRTVTLCLLFALALNAGERPGGWTGDYSPCDQHDDVLERGRMDVGVRFSTVNPGLAAGFVRAMNFWATIVDMGWHTENSRNCAIQVVDGRDDLFQPAESARAQFPGSPGFQGWIAFNPRMPLPASELFLTAVHEVGHLLGLPHSRNPSSIMYFLSLEGPVFLDASDLAALAARHKLRAGFQEHGEITGIVLAAKPVPINPSVGSAMSNLPVAFRARP